MKDELPDFMNDSNIFEPEIEEGFRFYHKTLYLTYIFDRDLMILVDLTIVGSDILLIFHILFIFILFRRIDNLD